MTCKQLGGACNKEFSANTFEQIAVMSKDHGTEMFESGDKKHIEAMEEMMKLMQNPSDMKAWFDQKEKEFESLPEE
jgi:hypothetical protein